jgi:TIR domain
LTPKLFISYSRAQTPFVDRLAEQLEDAGYSLWLDYQSLIPARPWFPQIEAGIDGADVVLLVVSRESVTSKNVEPEWKRALDRGKRIFLLIFEAVPLPVGLQTCEWVDFRDNYKRAFQQLVNRLERPGPTTTPPPQSGFKASPAFWASILLSSVVLIGSFPAWWTLVLPYVLAPLPRQIYQRNYVFHRVVPTLLALPLVYSLSWWMMFSSPNSIFYGYRWFAMSWFPLSLAAGWLLAGLLLGPDMQRRGLPEAARLRFANPLLLGNQPPRSVRFAIDSVPQDERYAEGLKGSLEEHGHRTTGEEQEPEAIFVLVSTYKKQTNYDTERQAVYPVLLQSVPEIDPEIQRIQWIDFRYGIEPAHKLARLLPEPERLLKGLAVAPTGTQEVFPFAVSALQYFILITGLLQGGGLLLSLLALLIWVLRGNSAWGALPQILGVALSGFLLLSTMNTGVNALRSRAKAASAFYPLLILNIFQIAISLSSMLVIAVYRQGANSEAEVRLLWMASRASAVNWVVLPLAVTFIILILLFRWRELYRWLPRRQSDSVSMLENWLLLYTPSRRGVLTLHLLFHGLFLLLYVLLNLWSIFAGWWFVPYLVFCCFVVILVMIGIRDWARRLSA